MDPPFSKLSPKSPKRRNYNLYDLNGRKRSLTPTYSGTPFQQLRHEVHNNKSEGKAIDIYINEDNNGIHVNIDKKSSPITPPQVNEAPSSSASSSSNAKESPRISFVEIVLDKTLSLMECVFGFKSMRFYEKVILVGTFFVSILISFWADSMLHRLKMYISQSLLQPIWSLSLIEYMMKEYHEILRLSLFERTLSFCVSIILFSIIDVYQMESLHFIRLVFFKKEGLSLAYTKALRISKKCNDSHLKQKINGRKFRATSSFRALYNSLTSYMSTQNVIFSSFQNCPILVRHMIQILIATHLCRCILSVLTTFIYHQISASPYIKAFEKYNIYYYRLRLVGVVLYVLHLIINYRNKKVNERTEIVRKLSVIVKQLLSTEHQGRPQPIEYLYEEIADVISINIGTINLKSPNDNKHAASKIALEKQFIEYLQNVSLAKLWSDVIKEVERDHRLQTVDVVVDGSKKRCWRLLGFQSPIRFG